MAIDFVGCKVAGKAGAASGNSTMTLSSGLSGGISSSVAEDDLVIAIFGVGSSGAVAALNLDITDGVNDYTLIGSQLFSNDNYEAHLRVAYKFMGPTPDASVIFGPTRNADYAGVTMVMVFRGVDKTTPLDVAATTATGLNTNRPTPPAITPSTAGAWIFSAAASAHNGGAQNYYNVTGYTYANGGAQNDTDDVNILGAYKSDWTSGTFTPTQWLHDASDSTNFSWAALTLALRPAATAGGNIKVWNGSAWVAKPVKVWNGSAWVAKPVKVWNGSAWVTTDY